MIYLGGPYSHPNPEIEAARYQDLTQYAAELVAEGKQVYSPITHTHPIHLEMLKLGINLGSEEWCRFDEPFMDACSELVILLLPGWNESSGVAREIAVFEAAGKPVTCVCPCAMCVRARRMPSQSLHTATALGHRGRATGAVRACGGF